MAENLVVAYEPVWAIGTAPISSERCVGEHPLIV
jgi:triosephosphate isomerase